MAVIAAPPVWSEQQLSADSAESIELFREERTQEPLEQYLKIFYECSIQVENLLESTLDLSNLRDAAYDVLLDDWEMIHALRYIASPAVSMDDLRVLVESVVSLSQLKKDPSLARSLVDIVLLGLDRERFPWLGEAREPTSAERETATIATSALIATQRMQTKRRNESKSTQEGIVKERLVSEGYVEVNPRDISTFSKAPKAGHFCGESKVAGRKADIVVTLWDDRVMPIECKVSNSSTNSVKRLNNDAAAKAVTWLQKFGTENIVPAAVLGGVFKTHNLKSAQQDGLTLFWAHNLDALIGFVESTRP